MIPYLKQFLGIAFCLGTGLVITAAIMLLAGSCSAVCKRACQNISGQSTK